MPWESGGDFKHDHGTTSGRPASASADRHATPLFRFFFLTARLRHPFKTRAKPRRTWRYPAEPHARLQSYGVSPSSAASFKLLLLCEVALGDFQGLWEPVRLLRADPAGAMRSDEQTVALATAVLCELLDEELIYLFRCAYQEELQVAVADERSRLSRKEADVELADAWWSVIPVRRADIWIAATDAGEQVARETGTNPERA
jgi:hypothetical protein